MYYISQQSTVEILCQIIPKRYNQKIEFINIVNSSKLKDGEGGNGNLFKNFFVKAI